MLKLNLLPSHEISDDTIIIRHVNKSGLIQSIGALSGDKIISSFPLNLLSCYRNSKDKTKQDNSENIPHLKIPTHTDRLTPSIARVISCNETLISCWTAASPGLHINKNIQKYNEDEIYTIYSTVGRVKKHFQTILNVYSKITYGEDLPCCVMNAAYGKVLYYPETGADLTSWQDKTNPKNGADTVMVYAPFYKNEKHEHQNEVRFSMILNNSNIFCDQHPDSKLATISLAKGLIYPKISHNKGNHYIDGVSSLSIELPKEILPIIKTCQLNTFHAPDILSFT